MAEGNVVSVTESNFEDEVTNASVPVVVDFWAEWCGPCKSIAPVLESIAQEKGDAVKIAKVDVDSNQALAAKFNVRSIPMLVFFKDGEVRDTVVGAVPKQTIVSRLEALA